MHQTDPRVNHSHFSQPVPIHHALLSLLDRDESYGYELRAELERSAGPQWGQLNIGHVYQLLERLKRDGLVQVVRSEPQPRRTERVIYAITEAGRRELADWLAKPAPPSAGYRDEVYLKLSAAARAGADTFARVVSSERQALFGELHTLHELASSEDDALVALLIDGASLQVQARIQLLDRAEQLAPTLAASGGAVEKRQRRPEQAA